MADRDAMPPSGVLESALYVDDLDRAEAIYGGILRLERIARAGGRHVFYRCGDGVLLLFDARRSERIDPAATLPVPPHGARGPGHLAFRAEPLGIDAWRERLTGAGIVIESEVRWPQGGRSIYVRDPAGNSVEWAEAHIWAPLTDAPAEG